MNIKDFKWTEKRFGTTFANILKKLGGLSKDGTDGSIEYKDDDGNVTKLVTDSNFSSLLAKNGLIEVKWQELKDKRDNGELIPGSLYRIIDYNCTTTQENTQSAGHQFDIVLLALSENKLAEEGWAMEHPTDVYDVTLSDGVTKKCYINFDAPLYNGEHVVNIVDIETLLGYAQAESYQIDINQENKTAISEDIMSGDLDNPDATYNYFQNSNLSAWKVWYCLDNDKSRFAWADNDKAFNISYQGEDYQMVRDTSNDVQGLYAWSNDDIGTLYTNNETPQIGDNLYWQDGTLAEENELTKGIYFTGRGVIYRLIDEFNNDIKYDFKNIQFKRKITNGQYDATNGTETWCYTLNLWYDGMCQDASIVGNTLPNDEGFINGVYDNKFGCATAFDLYLEGVSTFAFALGDNVVLSLDDTGYYYGIFSNTIEDRFIFNTIGNFSFCGNTIGRSFQGNIIGANFDNNTIGSDFKNNTINSSFHFNTIGNSFGSNIINKSFRVNIVGNNFNNKTINDNTSGKNYGNNGVELATKNDIGNIETALSNI